MNLIISTPQQAVQSLLSRRKELKLTQQAIARPIGLTQTGLSKLERNPEAMTLDKLLMIANALGLEVVLRDKTDISNREW